MRNLILLPLLLFPIVLFSQTKQDTTWKSRLTKVENRLNENDKLNTEAEIALLKSKIDLQDKLYEQTVNSISNQLDYATYNLTLFGILFAIAAIGLGIYVTYVERKIVRIGEENKDLLEQNKKIKQDVQELNQLIQKDIYNLFLKLKREETVHILDRLVKVPKDIANVSMVLTSRELQNDDFLKLKKAYLVLGEKDDLFKSAYKILFFQHFLAQTLKDEELRDDVSDFIPSAITASFENDIIKSTSDFSAVLVERGIQEYKKELNLFFNGLTNSQYKGFNDVYQLLFDNLKSRENRFDTFNTVESTQDKRVAKISFGRILRSPYSGDNPSEGELLDFKELDELTAIQQNEDDALKRMDDERKKHREKGKIS